LRWAKPIWQETPHLSLTKTATELSFDAAGETLHYTLVATNDGNVTLTGVSITDAKLGTLTCTQPVNLAPAETRTGPTTPGRCECGQGGQHGQRQGSIRLDLGARCPGNEVGAGHVQTATCILAAGAQRIVDVALERSDIQCDAPPEPLPGVRRTEYNNFPHVFGFDTGVRKYRRTRTATTPPIAPRMIAYVITEASAKLFTHEKLRCHFQIEPSSRMASLA
jgi:hypothetical protein